MKKQLLSLLALAAIVAIPVTAAAQADSESSEAQSPQTEEMTMAEMSKKVTKFDKFLAALPKFSGYAQVGYQYQTNAGGIEDANSSTFMVKRMRLIMTGDISKTFEYKMQFEGFSSTKGVDNKALISVQDMFLKAKVSPALHFWVGQFPIPLTMENYDISPGTLEVPDFSLLVLNMVCRNAVSGVVTYGRDLGVQATGGFIKRNGFNIIDYNICVFNGSQMNISDDNKTKDIVARLTIRPLRDLRFSASVNWGEYVSKNKDFGKYVPMTRYAVGAWYNESNGLMVRSEYGHAGTSKNYDAGRAKVDEEMFYATAGYNFAGKYMPVIRYDLDNIKQNTCLGVAGKQQDFLVGFLWQPINHLKVQADYVCSMYDSNNYSAENFGTKTGHKFQLMVIGYF